MMPGVRGYGKIKEERHAAQVDGSDRDLLLTRPSTEAWSCE